jgi:hypothetical protein
MELIVRRACGAEWLSGVIGIWFGTLPGAEAAFGNVADRTDAILMGL